MLSIMEKQQQKKNRPSNHSVKKTRSQRESTENSWQQATMEMGSECPCSARCRLLIRQAPVGQSFHLSACRKHPKSVGNLSDSPAHFPLNLHPHKWDFEIHKLARLWGCGTGTCLYMSLEWHEGVGMQPVFRLIWPLSPELAPATARSWF